LAPGKIMKRFLATALCFALALSAQPVPVVAGPAKVKKPAADAGEVSGRAVVDGKPLANVAVRLRNVDLGEIVGTTTANAAGEFLFTGVSAGHFIVEIVSANGVILGTSKPITLTVGAMISGHLTVSTSAAALAAGGGVSGGLTTATAGAAAGVVASVAGGGLGALLGSTVGIVTLSAATAGITAGVVASRTRVSGSQ
jgi:hypothetical protein